MEKWNVGKAGTPEVNHFKEPIAPVFEINENNPQNVVLIPFTINDSLQHMYCTISYLETLKVANTGFSVHV